MQDQAARLAQGSGDPGRATAEHTRHRWAGLLALTFVALLIRLAWAMLIPYNQAPDEYTHLAFVSFLAQHGRLPNLAEIESGTAGFYGGTSPVPYLLQAAFAHWLDGGASLTSAIWIPRLGSVIEGAAAVWLAGLASYELFEDRSCIKWGIPVFVAFLPQFTFVSSSVNADAFTVLVSTFVIWILARLLRDGTSPGDWLWVGTAGGLLILSKPNGLALVPATILAVGLSWFQRRERPGEMARGIALALAITAALAGPFMWHDAHAFDGDVLGVRTMFAAWRHTFPQVPPSLEARGFGFGYLWIHTPFVPVLFRSFWGLFGYMSVQLSKAVYAMLEIASIASCLGLVWVVGSQVRRAFGSGSTGTDRHRLAVTALCLCAVATNLLLAAWTAWANDFQAQGRYLFPSLFPIAALFLMGLCEPWRSPRVRTAVAIAAVGGLLALNLWCYLGVLVPLYAR